MLIDSLRWRRFIVTHRHKSTNVVEKLEAGASAFNVIGNVYYIRRIAANPWDLYISLGRALPDFAVTA